MNSLIALHFPSRKPNQHWSDEPQRWQQLFFACYVRQEGRKVSPDDAGHQYWKWERVCIYFSGILTGKVQERSSNLACMGIFFRFQRWSLCRYVMCGAENIGRVCVLLVCCRINGSCGDEQATKCCWFLGADLEKWNCMLKLHKWERKNPETKKTHTSDLFYFKLEIFELKLNHNPHKNQEARQRCIPSGNFL